MAGNTRERILEVSLELFAQSGYLGTSMSDIAEKFGMNVKIARCISTIAASRKFWTGSCSG